MINIIGLGYIGLPTALMLAKSGEKIVGTDVNVDLVNSLSNGILTFEESGIETLFEEAFRNGIKFTTEYQSTDMYIITVPTPYVQSSKKIDLKYVISAVKGVLEVCKEGAIIVIESTISPGSTDNYIRPLIEKYGKILGKDINLVHAPERIIPGNMIHELENNSRTIGADNSLIGEKVKKIYSSFCKSEIVVTDIRTAEMTK
jgi:UDP-N-acetyl-D-mannosaminuronic acid dehydrogenase